MRARWLVLAVLTVLQGCSPPPPVVLAMLEAGGIVFHVRDPGLFLDKIFGWDDANYVVERMWIVADGRTVLTYAPTPARSQPCNASETFPLRLGEARCGFGWNGEGASLRPGQRYGIIIRGHEVGDGPFCSQADRAETGGRADPTCAYYNDFSARIAGAFILKSSGRVVNLRTSEFPDECGTDHAQNGAVQEEWAEHCLAEPQREGVEKEGGSAENRAG